MNTEGRKCYRAISKLVAYDYIDGERAEPGVHDKYTDYWEEGRFFTLPELAKRDAALVLEWLKSAQEWTYNDWDFHLAELEAK